MHENSRSFEFASADDRCDAESAALITAVEAIGGYEHGRNAFWYFTHVVRNSFRRQHRDRSRRREREVTFTDMRGAADWAAPEISE